MSTLAATAPGFVELAHRIVWATVATVGPDGQPRTRILHPIWEWDGESLVGWIAIPPGIWKPCVIGSTKVERKAPVW